MDATQEPLIPWPDESAPSSAGGSPPGARSSRGSSSAGAGGGAPRRARPGRRSPVRGSGPTDGRRGGTENPSEAISGTLDRPSFVIQHHAARSLHYDFRLEWNGVLASWALPKGVPEGPGNRLAVQTDDHPLSYLTFHGDIEASGHRMSHVEIWDEGVYQIHEWADAKIVVTLYPSGGAGLGGRPVTLALIHTARPDPQDWLMRRVRRPE